MMRLIAFGISHTNATVDERSTYYMSADEKRDYLKYLKVAFSIRGAVVISTCNRTDIFIETDEKYPYVLLRSFIQYMGGKASDEQKFSLQTKTFDSSYYFLAVSTGLFSMARGDRQIYGQVRESYKLSLSLDLQGSFIERLFQAASHLHKDIRNQTDFLSVSESVSYLAVKQVLALENSSGDESLKALVVGAGDIARDLIPYLRKYGFETTLTNRKDEKAEKIAGLVSCNHSRWSELDRNLQIYPIIFSCISSKHFFSRQSFDLKDKLLVDFGVPRSIHVNLAEKNTVLDLDSFAARVNYNKDRICRSERLVRSYIVQHHHNYMVWTSRYTTNCQELNNAISA